MAVAMKTLFIFVYSLSCAALRLPANTLEDSGEKQVIFGMACGYSPEDIKPFIETLKATGYSGQMIVGGDSKLEKYLNDHGFKLHTEPCDEQRRSKKQGHFFIVDRKYSDLTEETGVSTMELQSETQESYLSDVISNSNVKRFSAYDRFVTYSEALQYYQKELPQLTMNNQLIPTKKWLGSLNQQRWIHYKQWALEGNYTSIWCVDMRDVMFQANPFKTSMPLKATNLHLFQEKSGLSGWERNRIAKCIDEQFETTPSMNNFCGGTIAGSADAAMNFFDAMTTLIARRTHSAVACHENDQPFLNYLANIQPSKDWHLNLWWEGAAMTTSDQVCGQLHSHRDAQGRLVNKKNEVIPVIHKYDRCNIKPTH